MKCPGSVSLSLGKSWKDHLTSMFPTFSFFCKSFGCQKSKNIKNISLTPTWNLSHASPKGPECRLCPALLFEGLFSRCDLSLVNGHSKVILQILWVFRAKMPGRARDSNPESRENTGASLWPYHAKGQTLGPSKVKRVTPWCYTERSKLVQTSPTSKSFKVPKVRHLKVISF